MTTKLKLIAGALLCACALASAHATEPPLTIIVPYAPGGMGDTVARLTAQAMTRDGGRTVIVENRPGANGMIGLQAISRANADGTTIGLVPASVLTVNPSIYKDMKVDTVTDISPLTLALSLLAASGENPILTPVGGNMASVPSFRAEELRVIVEEAHRLGRRVTAHARSGQSVVDCIEAGMDWIMHADCMNLQEADKLADSGIPCCPALTFMANIADWGHLAGCTQARIDRFKGYVDNAQKILSYAYEQGVTMMCGTDTGFAVTPYGEWHAREAELFVSMLGMSNLQAITCATKNAAIAVDPENVGTLETGKLADILLIDGDPCVDIKVLQDKSRLRAVYLGGAPVDLTPAQEGIRLPWERSLAISQTELYRQTVQQAA